jgi:hypothetical protein
VLGKVLNYFKTPRGIRNNNPGNIKRGQPWAGLSETQTDPTFCQFDMPEYGIRAMAKILITYNRRHMISCIQDAIARWAPSSENQTQTYINFVVTKTNHPPQQSLDFKDRSILGSIIKAMITFENGVQPYSDKQIGLGVDLALL